MTVLDLALIRHFTVALRRCAVVVWQNLGLSAPSLIIRLPCIAEDFPHALKTPLAFQEARRLVL